MLVDEENTFPDTPDDYDRIALRGPRIPAEPSMDLAAESPGQPSGCPPVSLALCNPGGGGGTAEAARGHSDLHTAAMGHHLLLRGAQLRGTGSRQAKHLHQLEPSRNKRPLPMDDIPPQKKKTVVSQGAKHRTTL